MVSQHCELNKSWLLLNSNVPQLQKVPPPHEREGSKYLNQSLIKHLCEKYMCRQSMKNKEWQCKTCNVQELCSQLVSRRKPCFGGNKVQWGDWLFGCVTHAWAGTPNALDWRAEKGKWQAASNPGHGAAVGDITSFGNPKEAIKCFVHFPLTSLGKELI